MSETRRISEIETSDPDCQRCDGTGWVCENHPTVAWAGMTGEDMCGGAEYCGGAGMPCPTCNALALTHPE
jgi:hypothetical protein